MFDGDVTAGEMANESASAPGDLPLSEVRRRIAAQRGQFRHDNAIEPLAPEPDRPVIVTAFTGEDVTVRRAAVFYTADGSDPGVASAEVPMESDEVTWSPEAGYLTRWRAALPGQPAGTVVRYRIGGWQESENAKPDLWAHDGQGFHFRHLEAPVRFAYSVEPAGPPLPAWVREAVIYHVFLDRFHPGTVDGAWHHEAAPDGFHGGTLFGAQMELPYLQDFGVTCLWLSPVTASPSYHRYDTIDYYTVDPRLGTNADLRALVDAAHALDLRVIMDFVPAHLSWEHPAFIEARANRDAPDASWFTFDEWPERYRMFLDMVPMLPSVNTEDPGARAHLIGSAVRWVREFGIDGFRIDHAIGPGMDFFVELRRSLREVSPDAFTVGEVTDTPNSLRRYRNRLDAVLDFPVAGFLRQTFGSGAWDLGRLERMLDRYERYMAAGPGRLSFLDNHDMNRFIWEAGNDTRRLKLAALCQFTLAATPVIYYGTEVGIRQEAGMGLFGGDALVRGDMPWDRSRWDEGVLRFYRELIRLRRGHYALRAGRRETLSIDPTSWLFRLGGGEDEVLAAFNTGEERRGLALPEGSWRIVLATEEGVSLSEGLLELPTLSGALLLTQGGS